MIRELRFAFAASSLLIGASLAGQSGGFQPKCPWPFNEVAARQPFDDQCNQGKTKDPGTIVQDVVKDNFCVTGTPITVDIPTLVKLQADVESPSMLGPNYTPPKDRSALQTLPTRAPDGSPLGEGRLVQMVTFIFEAHYSDVKSGESVNCKIPGAPNNDIHVAVVSKPDETDECQSVTTEITPHFRPAESRAPSRQRCGSRCGARSLLIGSRHSCEAINDRRHFACIRSLRKRVRTHSESAVEPPPPR
jgi:hypothetical protein